MVAVAAAPQSALSLLTAPAVQAARVPAVRGSSASAAPGSGGPAGRPGDSGSPAPVATPAIFGARAAVRQAGQRTLGSGRLLRTSLLSVLITSQAGS